MSYTVLLSKPGDAAPTRIEVDVLAKEIRANLQTFIDGSYSADVYEVTFIGETVASAEYRETRTWRVCDRCGACYAVGDSPYCRDGHAPVGNYHPFIPYFDIALGRDVSSLADRWNGMKEHHLDYRDKMSPGEISARRDRCAERHREEARG